MAGKNNSNSRKGGFGDVEFVNYSWTRQDDEKYLEWLKGEAPTMSEIIDHLNLAGYKLSIAYDDNSRSERATFICSAPKHPHNGYGFSGWGDNSEDAVFVAAYKIVVIFEGISPEEYEKPQGGRR